MRNLTGMILGASFAVAAGGTLADASMYSPQPRYHVGDEGRIYVGSDADAGAELRAPVVTGPSDVEMDGRGTSSEWAPATGWNGASDVVKEKEVGAKAPDVNEVSGRS